MSNRVNFGGRAADASALMDAAARKVSDALDYEAVAPPVTLAASADRIYLAHCPVLMFLTYGVRISVAAAGTGSVQVQVYAAGLPLFADPVSITGETTLFPVSAILPARQSIAAGARLEVRIVSLTGTGYSVWQGLRVAFLLRDPDSSVTTDALDMVYAGVVAAQQDADLALGGLNELAAGGVLLRRDGRDTVSYVPGADSDAGRMLALAAALEEAGLDEDLPATIELLNGRFGIADGAPLSSFLPDPEATHVSVIFGGGASVLYADETDATADWRLYPGNVRYARHFGAAAGVADNQPRFQAALFSMPPNGAPVYQPVQYPALQTRMGALYLEEITYDILDSIWITGYQDIIGAGGRESVIALAPGFAPASGDEKFGIETACYLPGGGAPVPPGLQAGANFTFSIKILNIQIANQGLLNAKASGLRYGCAQGGMIRVVTSAMGSRGIVLLGNTCHIEVHHWGVAHAAAPPDVIVQTGPHLSGNSCVNCHCVTVSEEHLNNYPVVDHLDYTDPISGATAPLSCVMFYGSRNLRFESCAGESNGNYMYFKDCHGAKIGNIDHASAEVSGHGGTVVRFDNCINSGFESIYCTHFQNAYVATSFGESTLVAGTPPLGDAVNFPAGPFNTTGDTFIAIAGAPTTFHVPANCSRDVLNTTSGVASRWINNGGVLQSIPYA